MMFSTKRQKVEEADKGNKVEDRKLFYGLVPHYIDQQRLKTKLEEFGSLATLVYCQDQLGGDRGWGFVTFESQSGAKDALEKLNNSEDVFPGQVRPFHIKLASQKVTQVEGTVFEPRSEYPSPWKEFHTEEGDAYYFNGLTEATVWEKPPELVQAENKAEMMKNPQAAPPVQTMSTSLQSAPIQPTTNPVGSSMNGPPGSNLFIVGMPTGWTDETLVKNFEPFGVVLSAKIQADEFGASRGFGFASFQTPEMASAAIFALNGVSTEGKTLKVELKKGDEVNAVAPPAGVERMSHEKLPSVTGVRKPAAGNWAPNMMMMPGQIPSGLTSLSSASGVGGLAALGLGNLGLGGLGMQQLANLRLGGTMPALTGLPSVPALTGMGTVPALTGASTGAATTQPGLLG
mmetsp:Transcript_56756/g.124437  ORF Transcript_56756/g.124437 Transcript_56756/m.124437 type:complete len:402 (+) Transcript_56756:23-1228(+)